MEGEMGVLLAVLVAANNEGRGRIWNEERECVCCQM